MKRAFLLAIVTTMIAASCSSDTNSSTVATSAAAEPLELIVFAASSLTDAFTEIGDAFSAENADVTITFNFGSSTDLAVQIQSEGTADVFASASGTAMDVVTEDPGITDEVDFATNSLVVVTPPDNPAGIAAIEDLGADGVQLVLGAEGVPVGDYARQALDHAGVLDAAEANVVSNEEDNASVVAKIVSGEADAAIVYGSDVSAAADNDLASFAIPDDLNVIATYPIAAVTGSANTSTAQAFITYVMGPGQATLAEYGFGPAPG
jgi:molybdate transport system substrate-binding protein